MEEISYQKLDLFYGKIELWEMYIQKLESLIPKDDEYIAITKILKNAEDDINQWLFENGFKTTSRMGSLVSIAKFVDSFELDKGEYKNFSILENLEDFDNIPSILGTRVKIKYTEPNLKSEYSYELTTSSEFDKHLGNGFNIENKLVQLVYVVNESKKLDGNITKKEEEKFSYNEELNENLNLFSGIIKSSMYASFQVVDNKLVRCENNYNVNSAYEEKMKSFKGG